jgi:hypothetical protein
LPLKRLSAASGLLADPFAAEAARIVDAVGPAPLPLDRLQRPAVLVHSGPNGSAIEFGASNGEVSFDDERIREIAAVHNSKLERLKAHYPDGIPVGAFLPILDGHDDDKATNIGGRLLGALWVDVRSVPHVGEGCTCLMGQILFLGEDVVKRALDGRIYHLSVGIGDDPDSEGYNELGEVSTVVNPAAIGAMVLKKRKNEGDKKMSQKKLAAARRAKMTALTEGFKQLSAKLVATKETTELAKRKSEVTARLSSAMKSGKLTPAEFKKMDVKRLSAMKNADFDTLMHTIDALEPKVLLAQRGTTAGVEVVAELKGGLEKSQKRNLKAEARKDLKKMGAKLKASDDEKELDGEEDDEQAEMAADPVEKKMADQPAKEEKQLEADPEGQQMDLSGVQPQIDELSTQVARLAGMLNELMEAEQAEDAEMGADDDSKDENELAPGKKLAGEDEEGAELSDKEKDGEKNLEGAEEKDADKKLEKKDEPEQAQA